MKRFIMLLALMLVFTVICTTANSGPGDATITMRWTAPGDDGIVGRADVYDIRVTADTTLGFEYWQPISQSLIPLMSGQAEILVTELTFPEMGQTYYFAIKSADEVPNWSLISSIVSVFIPDTKGPSVIIDFSVTLDSVSN